MLIDIQQQKTRRSAEEEAALKELFSWIEEVRLWQMEQLLLRQSQMIKA